MSVLTTFGKNVWNECLVSWGGWAKSYVQVAYANINNNNNDGNNYDNNNEINIILKSFPVTALNNNCTSIMCKRP